ncbi:MAG: hypothetical protein KatS3mg105_3959 [Gemmatales bacterium]|nr:MAG: hypothetical protein KatS3mg105_3959 [Gemmatales bacterium]
MISFQCRQCRRRLKVEAESAGKKVRCPRCQHVQPVPDPNTIATIGMPPAESDESKVVSELGDSCNDFDFLSPPQERDEIGRLGGYRILKQLGAGGMGVVFLAEDRRLKRRVAVKVMLPKLASKRASHLRFRREAQAAAKINHDHIVTIYHVGNENGVPYLAMQFLQGMSLEERLHRDGKLPVCEVVRIARETAEGLAAAHEAGLIHRDIKPGNIWLEAPRGRVKLLDFGLARIDDEVALTHAGTIVGTPAYMAPEQARGQDVDCRCDLFSLGCVIYHMATGDVPFKGNDPMSTVVAVTVNRATPLCEKDATMPPALSQLVDELLEKQPQRRPESAREVAERLALLQSELSHVANTVPLTPATNESRLARSSTGWYRQLATQAMWLLVGIGALLGLGALLGQRDGELHLEAGGRNVAVFVMRDGQQVAVLDPANPNIRLAAGTYELKIKDAPNSGLALVPDVITLAEDSKATVEVVASSEPPSPNLPGKGWRKLFNGKNLAGWKVLGSMWSVDKGVLSITPESDSWLLTPESYRDYELYLEFKLAEGAAASVALRVVRPTPVRLFAPIALNLNDGSLFGLPPLNRVNLAPETWHRLHVRFVGFSLEIRIDDQVVHSISPRILKDKLGGRPGLVACPIGFRCQSGERIAFRNIYLRIPEKQGD